MAQRRRWMRVVMGGCICAACAGDGWTWQRFEGASAAGLTVVRAGWDEGRFAGSTNEGSRRWGWAVDAVNSSEEEWTGVIEVVSYLDGEEGVVASDTLVQYFVIAPGAGATLTSRGVSPSGAYPRRLSPRFDLWIGVGCPQGATPKDPSGCAETGRMALAIEDRD